MSDEILEQEAREQMQELGMDEDSIEVSLEEMRDAADDLRGELRAIRERAEAVSDNHVGWSEPHDVQASLDDVPRLLEAVEAVLWYVDLYRQQIESLREPAERYGGYFQGQLAMAEEVVRGLEETMTEKLGAGDDGTD